MVVQHNLTAMNSNRMLGITTGTQAKSTERLSSGYKINRAADDAAGLSISEKMRKQVRGLTQASANAEDGISAVQTAEGALTEVHDMLQRMNELAVKSANGTNSDDDRSYIQNEVDALIKEIDRVAETTKFNETYLLKGDADAGTTTAYSYKKTDVAATFSGTVYSAGGAEALNSDDAIAILSTGGKLYSEAAAAQGTTSIGYTEAKAASAELVMTAGDGQWSDKGSFALSLDTDKTVSLSNDNAAEVADVVTKLNDIFSTQENIKTDGWSASYDEDNAKLVVYNTKGGDMAAPSFNAYTICATAANLATQSSGNVESFGAGIDGTLYAAGGTEALDEEAAKAVLRTGGTLYSEAGTPQGEAAATDYTYEPASTKMAELFDKDGKKISASKLDEELEANNVHDEAGNTVTDLSPYTTSTAVNAALTLNLHVGADSTTDNKISVKIDSMTAAGIGVKDLKVDTETTATDAIDTIEAAIQAVSAQRSSLGAAQNRLEHTISNLDNVVENTTSAESQIRDTDMATEMVKYSNNNILAQAGQAMLAQANQSNQGVLSLIQ